MHGRQPDARLADQGWTVRLPPGGSRWQRPDPAGSRSVLASTASRLPIIRYTEILCDTGKGGPALSELPIEDTPAMADAAHEAFRGEVIYITDRGERIAAIVPPGMAAVLERLSADVLDELAATATRGGLDDIAELLEALADRAAARDARARIAAGGPLIPWEQVKAKAGL